jgi:acetyl-CoA carboxylase biotin carboxyl carrier protein
MDLERIEKLLELLARHDVSEFSYAEGDWQLSLRIGAVVAAAPVAVAAAPAPARAAEAPAEAADDGLFVVRSPMVGTFYRSPRPGQPAYVDVGDRIEVGKPVCIVEAMKLMNAIDAEVSGTIVEICVENAQPVEFGQALFKIRRS